MRLLFSGSIPVGLNQDEASAGYEAWALLNYGIDRNGDRLPVLFVSWGSGQNVLYSYLSMPIIALFGLNGFSTRLLAGLIGSATLPIFYLLAKKIRDGRFGLLALFMLALNPWHIMLSRWALESNLLPFFLLLGIYFLIMSRERPAFMPLSAAAFALSLYSYGTAFIFLPGFLLLSIFHLIYRGELKLKVFLPSLGLFFVLALPVSMCNIRNIFGLEGTSLLGLTLPALTQTRQAATTVFGGGGLGQAVHNLGSFLKLLWTQNDGLPWNSTDSYGLFYNTPGIILSAYGLICCIHDMAKRESMEFERFILNALIAAFFSACLIDINVNRINMAFLPVVYFQSLGIYFISRILGRYSAVAFVSATALLCSLFAYNYFTDYQKTISPYFFEGLGEAIEHAESLDTETIWITHEVNSPYIYALFYNQIPPSEFIDSVEYADYDSPFRTVSGFGKYQFGGDKPKENCVFILPHGQSNELNIVGQYANFDVATLP